MSELKSVGPPMLAVLGGTFNPVHYGHLSVASQIAWQLSIPVHLMLSARPPHRQDGVASAQQRWEMLQLAVQEHEGLIADRRELDRDGPSFMVDTLAGLQQDYPGTIVCLALGSDAAEKLASWHRSEALADLCHLVLIDRPGTQRQTNPEMLESLGFSKARDHLKLNTAPAGYYHYMSTVALEISASAIRQLVAAGGPIRYMAPPSVVNFVRSAGLYTR